MRTDRRIRVIGVMALVAGFGLMACLIYRSGIAPIASTFSKLGVWGFAIVVLAHLPVLGLLGIAWRSIGRTDEHARWIDFAWARAVRDAASEALPLSQVGGYVIGARALTLTGAGGAVSAASTLVDLILEFSAKLPYLVIGLAVLEWLRPSEAALAAVIVAFVGTVTLAALAMAMQRRGQNLAMRTIERIVRRWPRLESSREKMISAFRVVAQGSPFRVSLPLHFLCWLLGAAETWLIFWLMQVPVTFGVALVIDSLVGAIRMVAFFVPGAIGVQEGGYVLLCGMFGLPPGVGLAFSLTRRARDVLIAVPMLLSWKYREAATLIVDRKPHNP